MSRFRYQKEFIFAERKVDDVRRFLKDKPNTDLSQVMDEKQNTVLHQCAYQGSLDVLKEYINFMRMFWKNSNNNRQRPMSESQVNELVKKWVNKTNKEGFTCLHYAAYMGLIQILDYLDKLKADIRIKTRQGLGVLHLAGQGDKVKTFIFYRGKFDINEPDQRGSTPLHWAAYRGSEKVTQYLLSQEDIQLNPQDIEGQTPLHLATIQGNTKIVRRLLIAGADRHIKNFQNNKKGKQPIQIARQNQFSNIQLLLNDNYTWMDHIKFFFNIKIKYQPKKRSVKIPLFFVIFSLILITIITLTLDYHEDSMPIFWVQQGIFALLLILYLSLIMHNPKQRRGTYEEIQRIWINKQNSNNKSQAQINSSGSSFSYLNTDVNSICLRCIQYKPQRSNHCDICDTCIQQYDHHCPWINNCVGKHNIIRFIFFIILLFVVLNWVMVIAVQFFLVLIHDEKDKIGFFEINQKAKDNLPFLYGFVFISVLLYVVFVIPLFFLIIVHIANLLLGKTTYERFSKSNQSVLARSQRSFMGGNGGNQENRRGKVSCSNCVQMCFSRSEQQQRLL